MIQYGKDPEKIKQLLGKHKDFQRTLGARQPNYDAVMRLGKQFNHHALITDEPVLRQMMSDMKAKWLSVCNKLVDRQRKLEEGLLFSGQFKDAIQVRLYYRLIFKNYFLKLSLYAGFGSLALRSGPRSNGRRPSSW